MKHQASFSWFTNLYPLWLIILSGVGLFKPKALIWFNGQFVVWGLSLVMLSMGFTLTTADFRRLFRMPGSLALGFLAHYTIMPLSGWAVAHLLQLDEPMTMGLILVASCPSGTASNVLNYLARANVALAVMVTLTSTLLAFVMTPIWCKTLAGTAIPVPALKLCLSTLQMAVAPVLLGVFCNSCFPKATAKISRFSPPVSVLTLSLVTGGVVSLNAGAVIAHAGRLTLATAMLHVLGFAVGYAVTRALRYSEIIARTISIEVGMQNSGLAAALARQNFTAQPLVAVPAVFSSVVQNLLGSLLVAIYRKFAIAQAGDSQDLIDDPPENPQAFGDHANESVTATSN